MIKGELYNLIFAVSFILVGKIGDYLDEHPPHYTCPTYCDVDHKHYTNNIKESQDESYREVPVMDMEDCDTIPAIHSSL